MNAACAEVASSAGLSANVFRQHLARARRDGLDRRESLAAALGGFGETVGETRRAERSCGARNGPDTEVSGPPVEIPTGADVTGSDQ